MLWLIFTIGVQMVWPASVNPGAQAVVWTKGSPEKIRKVLSSKKYRVLDSVDDQKEFAKTGYLPPRARAALLERIKLEPSLKGMDDFDKDLLVMDAHALNLDQLIRLYPKLSPAQLTSLQHELKGLK